MLFSFPLSVPGATDPAKHLKGLEIGNTPRHWLRAEVSPGRDPAAARRQKSATVQILRASVEGRPDSILGHGGHLFSVLHQFVGTRDGSAPGARSPW